MINIDIKKFIRDRIWFGWYYATYGGSLTGEIKIPAWVRSTTSHWTIIDRTAAGRSHD